MAGTDTGAVRRQPGQRGSDVTPDATMGHSAGTATADRPTEPVVQDLVIHDEVDGSETPRREIIAKKQEIPDDRLAEDLEDLLNEGPAPQRHGCVRQIRGISVRNQRGDVIGTTEEWQCQCDPKQQVFRGRNKAETERLYLRHLRQVDPQVPKK